MPYGKISTVETIYDRVQFKKAEAIYKAAIWWRSMRNLIIACAAVTFFAVALVIFLSIVNLDGPMLFPSILVVFCLTIQFLSIAATIRSERYICVALGLEETELRYGYQTIIYEYETKEIETLPDM